MAWPAIAAGKSCLLLSPTGSGKTLAAFLSAIDRLAFPKAPANGLPGVKILYITPLKALGVDVERNLQAPLRGIQELAAERGEHCAPIRIGIRSGDTPPAERQRLVRNPPEILITTPESLCLMLTSQAARTLQNVETILIDEIHALVPRKRGTHLALSLERLETLCTRPPQRVGLSATQRPLQEIARFLGGIDPETRTPRPVELLNASSKKAMEIQVEPTLQDLAEREARIRAEKGEEETKSVWLAIIPSLLRTIRENTSTMVFVNSRVLAERITDMLNEEAGEFVAAAHHGSLAKDIREVVETQLKNGELPAIVCTSTLELGIDVGAVDHVVQIESPPSVASGVQRIGRAGHQVGALSRATFFPKFRHDLLSCATVVEHAAAGLVESTRYPRNALDVLSQQIVSIVCSSPETSVEALYALVRCAAPFEELPRSAFDGVLEMLSGRYPSERFGELRARLDWNRTAGTLKARKGSKLLSVTNVGTIPDRGLYPVFLAGAKKPTRVGELDEEMVFEFAAGDTFVLGTSTWRVEEIGADRVLVTPAPGERGMLPFWLGDGRGRPFEFGQAIGKLTRSLLAMRDDKAQLQLRAKHGLHEEAAISLMAYLREQEEATRVVPSDQNVVLEQFRDGVGNAYVVLLTPFGRPVHAPWAMAISKVLIDERGLDCDVTWTDDGVIFRFAEIDGALPASLFFPASATIDREVRERVGDTAQFASRFREAAGTALLLPKRRPGKRTPLWVTRRKSAQLLRVAKDFPGFPIILETFRECLQDAFDLPSLKAVLRAIESGEISIQEVRGERASPFANSVIFRETAAFLYTRDAPLPERQAYALTLDHAQLEELLGSPDLRDLIEDSIIDEIAAELRMDELPIRDGEDITGYLRMMGPLTETEFRYREVDGLEAKLAKLERTAEVFQAKMNGRRYWFASSDAGRFEALGVSVPASVAPEDRIKPPSPLEDIIAQYARRRLPFVVDDLAARFGFPKAALAEAAEALVQKSAIRKGGILPEHRATWSEGSPLPEYADDAVLARLRRRSIEHLQKQVKPVSHARFCQQLLRRHHIGTPKIETGGVDLDLLFDSLAKTQGQAITLSALDRFLNVRVPGAMVRDIDDLVRQGEVVWRCVSAGNDPKVRFYLREDYPLLASLEEHHPPAEAESILKAMARGGALFASELASAVDQAEFVVLSQLRELATLGIVTCDSLKALRTQKESLHHRGRRRRRGASEGRWSLLPEVSHSHTLRARRYCEVLLERYGVVVREVGQAEKIRGGFSAIYPVLKKMEELGKIRRGYFVQDLEPTQFCDTQDLAELRAKALPSTSEQVICLDATDPANPYGALLPWPTLAGRGRPRRTAGNLVFLLDGIPLGYCGKSGKMLVFLERGTDGYEHRMKALVRAFRTAPSQKRSRQTRGAVAMVVTINGTSAEKSEHAKPFRDAGFKASHRGLYRY